MAEFVVLQSRLCVPTNSASSVRLMMRSFVTFVFVLLGATLISCHEDIEFTKHLQSELEEFLSDNEHQLPQVRQRRSPDDDHDVLIDDHFKCKQHSKKSCCGKTNLFKYFGDQNKTLGKACYDEVSERMKQDPQPLETQNLFSCDKFKMMKKLQYCVFECVGKKRNLLTQDGSININEMKKYLSAELFKDNWQKELYEKILPKCLNEKYVDWPENEPGIKCNPFAVQFQHCLWREFETNCPKSEQKDSKKCTKLRNNLKTLSINKRKP